MKSIWLLMVFLLITSCFNSNKKKKIELNNTTKEMSKIAYSLGAQYGKSISELNFSNDEVEYFYQGLQDYRSNKLKISNNNIQHLAKKVDSIFAQKRAAIAESEKEKGKQFVDDLLKGDSSWQVSSSGLLFKIIKEGKKTKIQSDNPFVEMHFTSFHLDSKQYETTTVGNPKLMPLNGIFKAWSEAFKIGGVGSEIEVIAPPELTYGDNGATPYIAPGEYLKFNLKFLNYYSEKP